MGPVSHLSPETADPDPFVQFARWYDAAVGAGVRQPDAMTLATASAGGVVAARTVLLRGWGPDGFVFYTNLESAKARDLAANPHAALVLHWRELGRQVRIAGTAQRVAADVADRYWDSRPRGHRLSAWASPQSEAIAADELVARLEEIERRFEGAEPPRPEFWGGYAVAPDEIEFWESREDRLHDRVRYRHANDGSWLRERLAP